jgi:hypothetical protein
MCKAIEKPLIAIGGGFSQLVYYCSTLGKQMKVINGNEKGSALKNLKMISNEKLLNLNHAYHTFLEDLTGDYYSFDPEKSEWEPIGNVGMHRVNAEASIQGVKEKSASDLMKKV